ncbi:repetin-like isoform X2 [Trichoplusia ni]|uniref:Repetin-like isoform X2 n=1 Tax=Trichoplusia ni TaxID=7111 RepID=A0A7E5W0K4_TRINI|nr:repetin-like isoform X2 [Trichoplusia ni]
MRQFIVLAAVTALAVAKPELYKEKEDFQFSRSSTDEGSKSGYYGAQRGNMGGNYERAHNMDSLAQNQMSGLVRQVEGELGDGAKMRTGSVYTAANSRGTFGSRHFDLSNLQGRNFQEGATYDSAHSNSGLSSSAYNNAAYNSHSQSSQFGGYQAAEHSGLSLHSDSLQPLDNTQAQYDYGRHSTHRQGAAYAGYGSSDLNSADYGSNVQTRLISATPVRIIVRPGTKVAIPVSAQTYDVAQGSLINQNSLNSDAEVLATDNQRTVYRPSNAKHYEASYNYRKQWEKHETIPATVSVPTSTDNPFPRNSELYEDTQARASHDRYEASRLDSQRLHSSNLYAGYNGVKSASHLSNANFNTQQHRASADANSNAYTVSGYNAGSQGAASESDLYGSLQRNQYNGGALYHGSALDSSSLRQAARQNVASAADLNSQVESLSSKPKSYQSSYSYHKSWERQGDPYVIKPASAGIYDSQSSQRLTSATQNQGYAASGSHYRHSHQSDADCDENGHIRVARSYRTNPSHDTQQQSQNLEDFGQQTEDLAQQSVADWDQQQSQHTWDQGENLNQQSQNKWDRIEDLGQQTQHTWDKYGNFDQQSQNTFDKIENLDQQTQNLGQQVEDAETETGKKLFDFGQESQQVWDFNNAGQQEQDKVSEQTGDFQKPNIPETPFFPQESQTNDDEQSSHHVWNAFGSYPIGRPSFPHHHEHHHHYYYNGDNLNSNSTSESEHNHDSWNPSYEPQYYGSWRDSHEGHDHSSWRNSDEAHNHSGQHGSWGHSHEGHDHGSWNHSHEGHDHGSWNHSHEGHDHGSWNHSHEGHDHGSWHSHEAYYHRGQHGSWDHSHEGHDHGHAHGSWGDSHEADEHGSWSNSHHTHNHGEHSNTQGHPIQSNVYVHKQTYNNQNEGQRLDYSGNEFHNAYGNHGWNAHESSLDQSTNNDDQSNLDVNTFQSNADPLSKLWNKLNNIEQLSIPSTNKDNENILKDNLTSSTTSQNTYTGFQEQQNNHATSSVTQQQAKEKKNVTTDTNKSIETQLGNVIIHDVERPQDVGRGDISSEDITQDSGDNNKHYKNPIIATNDKINEKELENNNNDNVKDSSELHILGLNQHNSGTQTTHHISTASNAEITTTQKINKSEAGQENLEQNLQDFGQQQNIHDFGQEVLRGFDQKENLDQQNLQNFVGQGNMEQTLQNFGLQENLEQQNLHDFGQKENLDQQNLQNFGGHGMMEQTLHDFGQQENLEQQNLQDFGQKENLDQQSMQNFEGRENLQQQNLHDFGQQENLEQQNLQDFGQKENLDQQQSLQNFEGRENLQQQNLHDFGWHENLEQQNLNNYGQQENLPDFGQQLQTEHHFGQQGLDHTALQQFDEKLTSEHLDKLSMNPNSNLQPKTDIQHPAEIEETAFVQKISKDTHLVQQDPKGEVVSPVETQTEKPGFWKSVGSKFSTAKSKIASWFGSSS